MVLGRTPRAMAPPFGLTFLVSRPMCSIDMTAWDAKAVGRRELRISRGPRILVSSVSCQVNRTPAQPTLVELVQVDVVLRDTGALENLGDGERGTDTHEVRLDADDGGHAELAEDREAEFLSLGTAGEEDGGGTVRDLCVTPSAISSERPSVQTR